MVAQETLVAGKPPAESVRIAAVVENIFYI
jgi:hypothetical protein